MSFTRQPGQVNELGDALAVLSQFSAAQLSVLSQFSAGQLSALLAVLDSPTDLTDEDETAVNSGHEGTDDVIDNIRTRVGEIATALIAAGLITDESDA